MQSSYKPKKASQSSRSKRSNAQGDEWLHNNTSNEGEDVIGRRHCQHRLKLVQVIHLEFTIRSTLHQTRPSTQMEMIVCVRKNRRRQQPPPPHTARLTHQRHYHNLSHRVSLAPAHPASALHRVSGETPGIAVICGLPPQPLDRDRRNM